MDAARRAAGRLRIEMHARGTMRTSHRVIFSFVVMAAIGASAGTSCRLDGYGVPVIPREDPAVLSTTPAQPSLERRFNVDLRTYPDAASMIWEFGDGSVSINLPREQGESISHTYAANGTYTVKVHLFGSKNVLDLTIPKLGTGELPVTVLGPNQLPVARIAVRDAANSPPRTLELDGSTSTDSDGTIATFAWEFGDGASATGSIVQHTYAIPGRYLVRLTVTDDRGGIATTTTTVTANIPPTAAFTSDPQLDGNGREIPQAFTFDASGSTDTDGQVMLFTWDFGDGSAVETGAVVLHTFPNPGEFTVTLTVTDDLDGTDTLAQEIDATGTDPFISTTSVEFGVVDTNVTLRLDGFNFTANPTVRLTSTSNPDIVASNVTLLSDEGVEATFNLAGAPLGRRSIVLTDTAARTTTLTDGFKVVTATRVRMTTSLGDIVLELDPVAAPNTVANFFQYVSDGFYDGTVFHRVVNTPNPFVIQGGAFTSLGTGADPRLTEKTPRAAIDSEANNGRSNIRGTIAMALRGQDADSATDQFFINVADNTNLDNGPPPFTVFGNVVEGLAVADAIVAVPVATVNVQALQNGTLTTTSFDNVPVTDVTVVRAERE